jgi:hypothetical protein
MTTHGGDVFDSFIPVHKIPAKKTGKIFCFHIWDRYDWTYGTVARGPYGLVTREIGYYRCVKCGKERTGL